MPYILLVLTFIIGALQIDNLKLKPINKKAWITLFLLIIATVISFFVQSSESSQKTTDKQDVKTDNNKRDSASETNADLRTIQSNQIVMISSLALKAKIDSTRNTVVDSMVSINDRTITILQKTIKDQAKELDSLGRLHAEKHLTIKEKKDILNQIINYEKETGFAIKSITIVMTGNSNGPVFSSELEDFLKGNGYNVNGTGVDADTSLKGYALYFNHNNVSISIGLFKL